MNTEEPKVEDVQDTPVPPPPGISPDLLAQLPNPEEVMRQAAEEAERKRIEAHNLGVQMAREEKLARRRERRLKSGRATQGDLNSLKKKPGLTKPKRRASAYSSSSKQDLAPGM